MRAYFAEAPAADAAWAVFFLIGARLKRLIAPRLVAGWALEETGTAGWMFEESYSAAGDVAEVIALLIDGKRGGAPPATEGLSLSRLVGLDAIVGDGGASGPAVSSSLVSRPSFWRSRPDPGNGTRPPRRAPRAPGRDRGRSPPPRALPPAPASARGYGADRSRPRAPRPAPRRGSRRPPARARGRRVPPPAASVPFASPATSRVPACFG